MPYSPTWTRLDVGNGTVAATYTVAGGLVLVDVSLNWGSATSSPGGYFYPSMPVATLGAAPGSAWAFDASAARFATGVFIPNVYIVLGEGRTSASAPWAWATGDLLRVGVTAPIA